MYTFYRHFRYCIEKFKPGLPTEKTTPNTVEDIHRDARIVKITYTKEIDVMNVNKHVNGVRKAKSDTALICGKTQVIRSNMLCERTEDLVRPLDNNKCSGSDMEQGKQATKCLNQYAIVDQTENDYTQEAPPTPIIQLDNAKSSESGMAQG